MFPNLSTLPNKDDLFNILEIDDKAFEIISILFLSERTGVNITELQKLLEINGFNLTKNPIFDRLDILEEKEYITKTKVGREVIIKLNEENVVLMFLNNSTHDYIEDHNRAKKEVSKLSLDEIFKKMEFYSVNKGFQTLYFKLLFSLNPNEKENQIISYVNKIFDTHIDLYIEDLKRRGIKDTMTIFSKMEEIMNQNPNIKPV